MVHDTTPRHLRLVGDTEATDGVDLGVTYHHDDTTTDTDSGKGEPIEGRLLTPSETTTALTPTKAGLEEINARLRAALEAANTYALLAWARWMDATTGYVMDPHLRQDMLDDAERALDDKRVRAAKQRARALDPAKKAAAEREVERLKNRQVSELEVDARVLAARGKRLAARFMWPAAVVAGPVAVAVMGGPLACFLAWPAAWAWLALQGRAHARADLGTTATDTTTQLEEKARHLATATTPAPPAPQGQGPARVLGATPAETTVIHRLDPAYWEEHARDRGLGGLTPGTPTLGVTGISVRMQLGGKWTPAALRSKTDTLKAMLAVPEGAGVQVMPGETGDVAVVRIRTRTPDTDVSWNPTRVGIGHVPETGRAVGLDAYGHRLVAGVTGAGKSTAMRPWMASVVLNPRAALIFLDPKGQEAGLWEHCARTVRGVGADGKDEMYATLLEVVAELEWRQKAAPGTDWVPTEDHPELVVVVDEGAALVRMAKEREEGERKYPEVLEMAEYIATQGRAAKIWLHWATQYPTKSEGVPAQVTENIVNRLALHTASPQADRVVFDEQATATGWTPSELDLPGWGMLRTGPKDTPEHIQLWYMRDEQVQALPAREPWQANKEIVAAGPAESEPTKKKEAGGSWINAQGAVMAALQSSGPRTLAQLDGELDFSRSMIDRALKELQAAGRVTKSGGYGAAWRAL